MAPSKSAKPRRSASAEKKPKRKLGAQSEAETKKSRRQRESEKKAAKKRSERAKKAARSRWEKVAKKPAKIAKKPAKKTAKKPAKKTLTARERSVQARRAALIRWGRFRAAKAEEAALKAARAKKQGRPSRRGLSLEELQLRSSDNVTNWRKHFADLMRQWSKVLKEQGFQPRFRTYVEKNGTINAHMSIGFPEGVNGEWASEYVQRVAELAGVRLGHGFWMALGLKIEGDPESPSPAIAQTANTIWLYPRRSYMAPEAFLSMQWQIIPNIEEVARPTYKSLELRLTWTPDDKQPAKSKR